MQEGLEGDLLQYRPSMKKFESQNTKLEVIRCATFSQGFLNRQVIMLMSCQGVPDDIFMSKLNKAISNLNVRKALKRI